MYIFLNHDIDLVPYLLRNHWLLIAYMLKSRHVSILLDLHALFLSFTDQFPILYLCACSSTTWNNFFSSFHVQMIPTLHGSGQMPSLPSGRFLGYPIWSLLLSPQLLWHLHLLWTPIMCASGLFILPKQLLLNNHNNQAQLKCLGCACLVASIRKEAAKVGGMYSLKGCF